MQNIIIIIILLLSVTFAIRYMIKAKKRGEKCIGCPYASQCKGSCEDKK